MSVSFRDSVSISLLEKADATLQSVSRRISTSSKQNISCKIVKTPRDTQLTLKFELLLFASRIAKFENISLLFKSHHGQGKPAKTRHLVGSHAQREPISCQFYFDFLMILRERRHICLVKAGGTVHIFYPRCIFQMNA